MAEAAVSGVKALGTGLRILLEFMSERPDFSVGELSARTGLHKSQISKVLATYREHGLLAQDPVTRRYSVGIRAFALGSRFVSSHRLSREALPVLRALVDGTGLSARLSVVDGAEPLYLLGVEGRLSTDAGWRAGTRLPPHASAAGKILVAYLDPPVLERLLAEKGMPRFTPRTITDPRVLRRQLEEARRRGFAVAHGELIPAMGVVAVPVYGEAQQVIGALSLAYPEHLVGVEKEHGLVAILHEHARRLSGRMGGQVYPYGGSVDEGATVRRRVAGRRPGTAG